MNAFGEKKDHFILKFKRNVSLLKHYFKLYQTNMATFDILAHI